MALLRNLGPIQTPIAKPVVSRYLCSLSSSYLIFTTKTFVIQEERRGGGRPQLDMYDRCIPRLPQVDKLLDGGVVVLTVGPA